MAKITDSIEGYSDMTAEEKIAALEAYEIAETPNMSEYVKKTQFDKTASELASAKKQLKDKMSDDERKSQESAEALEEMKAQLAALQKEKTVSQYTAKYIAQGYDEKTAAASAAALADGDIDTVFANSQAFMSALEKKIRGEVLKDMPRPESGSVDKTITIADLRKMSASERYKFSVDHPDEYKKLYGG